MTITVHVRTQDELEAVAFHTGSLVEGRVPETTVTTEGGVRLRLVAPLGGAR